MGERMAAAFARPEADCVVPLPLHVGSRRAYNQTELIARGLASRWGLPVEARAVSWAVRREPQTRRSSSERAGISPDAFAVSDSLRGRRVVLVDDVYTTGATVRAALAALRRAGARPAGPSRCGRGGSSAEKRRRRGRRMLNRSCNICYNVTV